MAVTRSNEAPHARDRSDRNGAKAPNSMYAEAMEGADDYDLPEGVDFLQVAQYAESQNQSNAGNRQAAWQRALKAFHNEHSPRSKYLDKLYANRTKLFRPKTRSAIRKNMASRAAALFSTADVVSVKAEFDSNPVKNASAAVWHEVLNYRLDRTSTRSGIPWFLIAMGAGLDADLHAISVSKQSWEYSTVPKKRMVEVREPLIDEATGQPFIGPDGIPAEIVRQQEETYDKVTKDRPMVELIPPENVMLDESAPWYDPAQLSAWFIVRYPMTLDEARSMMKTGGKSGEKFWLDVPDDVLTSAAEAYDAKGVRLARQRNGQDRYERRSGPTRDHDIVWMHENFMRYDGCDYHFWSVGSVAYASKVRLTEEAYPEQLGSRPYTFGYGAIESHTVYPQAPVDSWQPLQQEANDLVNLQLDVMKQWASPIAKVRQGRMFDWNSLQRRGAGGIDVIVREPDDVTFDRPPEVAGSTYLQSDRINADMDDLSGTFSQGSVATNRAFNETVGGMRLLSGSANSVTEFDLRLWVETWVEPVLRQVVRLCQYYESDQTILSIAGERAKIVERFGVDTLTDEDLQHEASVKVNVGIGAADPAQRMQKLGMAFQMLGMVAPFFDKKKKIAAEEVIKEIMGGAGFNDGMRFFVDDEGGQQNPELMAEMAKLELERAAQALDAQMNEADNETKVMIENLKGRFSIIEKLIDLQADFKRDAAEREFGAAQTRSKNALDFFREERAGQREDQREQRRQRFELSKPQPQRARA